MPPSTRPPGPLVGCGPIRRCAYLVRDLDAAVAWWVEDWPAWERSAAEAGWDPVTYGDGGGFASFAYYDLGGPLLAEVMELNDATRWMTDTVRTAHVDWDGVSEPFRRLS